MVRRLPERALVLGAGGIVGQHLRLSEPDGIDATYHRKTPTRYFISGDLSTHAATSEFLGQFEPEAFDVVINLAGENRPDVVEKDPFTTHFINVDLPWMLSKWCQQNHAHYIHVSSQAVFSGRLPPYRANRMDHHYVPVNMYGVQKLSAEQAIDPHCSTIARLTFILGVQWAPHLGRQNPFERWCSVPGNPLEVCNRFFSPCTAWDAARWLWRLAQRKPGGVYHIGHPVRVSRNSLAAMVRDEHHLPTPVPVAHESFDGLAPRPIDTTWAPDCVNVGTFAEQFLSMLKEWRERMSQLSLDDRAGELAAFFGRDVATMKAQLSAGFHHFHQQVAESFRNAQIGDDDQKLLEWYRNTTAYIWELSAYHLDPGFNYMGMCEGIRNHVKTLNPGGIVRVLSLGDGIGDLALYLNEDPAIIAHYHDLDGSKTAEFARLRFWRRHGTLYDERFVLSTDWNPPRAPIGYDAIVALDFFEHLTDVEQWTKWVFDNLQPGGVFLAQNAFGIGDNEHEGSIPMHLVRNNKYVEGWVPLLQTVGFQSTESGWWRKP